MLPTKYPPRLSLIRQHLSPYLPPCISSYPCLYFEAWIRTFSCTITAPMSQDSFKLGFTQGTHGEPHIFQFALEGCPELSVLQAGIPSSKGSTEIFHSVLSSAAFHLRNAKGGSKRFHKLGLQHKAKALQALNTALIHLSDSHLHTVYLTAMLSLVTIDVGIPNPTFKRTL